MAIKPNKYDDDDDDEHPFVIDLYSVFTNEFHLTYLPEPTKVTTDSCIFLNKAAAAHACSVKVAQWRAANDHKLNQVLIIVTPFIVSQ